MRQEHQEDHLWVGRWRSSASWRCPGRCSGLRAVASARQQRLYSCPRACLRAAASTILLLLLTCSAAIVLAAAFVHPQSARAIKGGHRPRSSSASAKHGQRGVSSAWVQTCACCRCSVCCSPWLTLLMRVYMHVLGACIRTVCCVYSWTLPSSNVLPGPVCVLFIGQQLCGWRHLHVLGMQMLQHADVAPGVPC